MREDWEKLNYQDAVFKIPTSKEKLKQKEYSQIGKFPIVDQGQKLIGGFSDDSKRLLDCDLPIIVFGDHTKCVKLINFKFIPGADGTKVLQPKSHIEPKYIYYLTQILVKKIEDKGYARHYQHIEKEDLPLAPLPEQRAIVSKIEELFSDLDKGIDDLKKAKDQLVIYRQAVLKKAFDGELTKEWREEQINLPSADELIEQIKEEREKQYKKQIEDWKKAVKDWEINGEKGLKPIKPKSLKLVSSLKADDIKKLTSIPEVWKYHYLAYAGDLGRGKSKHRPRNDKRLFGGPYPFFQTSEVKAQEIIVKYSQTYSEFGLKQSKLWPAGTLCITIAANIAETGFLGIDACFPDSIVGYTPYDKIIDIKYIDYFFQSAKRRISAYAPATAQKNINLATLENLLMPYCSKKEQAQVVKEIESRLSICDKVEQNINESLEKAKALRQSILKKAFDGKLLSLAEIARCKEANDYEPAVVLLAKIKAVKNKNKKQKNK